MARRAGSMHMESALRIVSCPGHRVLCEVAQELIQTLKALKSRKVLILAPEHGQSVWKL